MLHGCNPFYLFDILQHGFLVSRGKGNYVGTWCTRWLHTALAYQQEMSWEGVSVTNAGPRVRVVLEVLADNSKRIKTYRGMRNKLTQQISNQQSVYPSDALSITCVHIIGMQASTDFIYEAGDLDPPKTRNRKWKKDLRDAEELIKQHNIRDVEVVSELAFRPPPRVTEQRKKGPRVRRVRSRIRKLKRSVVVLYQSFKDELTV